MLCRCANAENKNQALKNNMVLIEEEKKNEFHLALTNLVLEDTYSFVLNQVKTL